jgi:hypothetical protein
VSGVLRPAELSLRTGENGSLDVVVLGARDILAVDVVLRFDPTLLEVVEAVPGPLLTLGDVQIGAERNLEPGRARVRFTRPAPTSGAGAIGSFKFKALRAGTSPVAVESLTLIGAGGTTRTVAVPAGRVSVTP